MANGQPMCKLRTITHYPLAITLARESELLDVLVGSSVLDVLNKVVYFLH